jgi:signal transduction histidine kinase
MMVKKKLGSRASKSIARKAGVARASKIVAKKAGRAKSIPAFRVAARTLLHLGRELITSDEIAINELIKNSFDAGSSTVTVRLICPVPRELIISLIDTMTTSTQIFKKTLEFCCTSLKESIGRRSIGEKALEGFQETLLQLSRAKDVKHAVSLLETINFVEVADSGCGISEGDILPVFLTVGTDFKVGRLPPTGVDEYLGNKGIGRLAMMRLGDRAHVETWVAGAPSAASVEFDWRVFNDGDRQIGDIPIVVKKVPTPDSPASGTVVRVYSLRSDWLGDSEQAKSLQSFIRRLRSPFASARTFRIRVSINDQVAIAFPPLPEEVRKLADQHLTLEFFPGKVREARDEILTVTIRIAPDDESGDVQSRSAGLVAKSLAGATIEKLKAIGPFKLHILRFNRRVLRSKAKQDWVTVRPELDIWAGGIAIYRDGFRVGFTGSERDGDWLGLDHKALRGGGYVVNRIQVIGALEISHKGNAKLVDLTNREGLVSTPEADLLKSLLLKYAIDPLRSLVEAHDEDVKRKELESLVNDGTSTLNDRLLLAKRDISTLKAGVPQTLRSSVTSLDEHMHFISNQITKFETAIQKASEGREDILELAGVGNMMHGVMHELTRTTAQTRKLMLTLAEDASEETQALLNKLEGEIKAINTRLRQLDPLMPGARQVKRDIDVIALSETILKGYASRFQRHDIEASISVLPTGAKLKVRMVPGFLSLALENLISNSVHWIGQRESQAVTGSIVIEIDARSNVMSVTDNGPGVAFSDRERVFQPGFSLREKGKGYGLYLAREVAEFHGGKLYMDPHGDQDSQLHTFVLELPGASS